MSIVGQRLPDPYYGLVTRRAVRTFARSRKCLTCGYEQPTVEVPLVYGWRGENPLFCPAHHNERSVVITEITVTMARGGKFSSGGLLRCVAFGGVYRRRGCGLNFHKRTGEYKNRRAQFANPICLTDGKPTRWTTMEVAPTGIIVADITRCGRCGGKTRAVQARPIPTETPKPRGTRKRQGGTDA